MTRKQLLNKLLKIKETKQIGLTYVKELKDGVTAEIRAVGYINADYARAVKRKTGKTIKPMKRSWGERIAGSPIVIHKGEHYLTVKIIRKSEPVYYLDGIEIKDISLIAKIIAMKPMRDEIVKVRDFNLKNITRVTLSGRILRIK